MALSLRFAGFPPALCRMLWRSLFPEFEDSLKRLSALVTYLRTWVDSWVATQPRAMKKMSAKATARSKMEPKSVSHAGSALSGSLPGCLGDDLLGRPESLARRDFGALLWALRSIRTP